MKDELNQFTGKKVVLDTRTSWVYVGMLSEITAGCAVLTEVDVHDGRDTSTTNEVYVMESKSTGVIANRGKVFVNLEYIVSFSLLKDVKSF